MNTGCFLSYSVFGILRRYSPYIATSRSRLNPTCMPHPRAGSTSMNSFYQKGPVHFKTAGELQKQAEGRAAGIQYRAVKWHHVQHPAKSEHNKPASVSVKRPGSVSSAGLHLWWWQVLGEKWNSSSLETVKGCQYLLSLSCCLESTHGCFRSSVNSLVAKVLNARDFFRKDRTPHTATTRWKILSTKVCIEVLHHYNLWSEWTRWNKAMKAPCFPYK